MPHCFVVRRAGQFVLLMLLFSANLLLKQDPGELWCSVISV